MYERFNEHDLRENAGTCNNCQIEKRIRKRYYVGDDRTHFKYIIDLEISLPTYYNCKYDDARASSVNFYSMGRCPCFV